MSTRVVFQKSMAQLSGMAYKKEEDDVKDVTIYNFYCGDNTIIQIQIQSNTIVGRRDE